MNIPELITSIPNLISNAVEVNQWIGYAAIFLAMFLENIIPPIPSELIMPLGGFYVQQGDLQFIPVDTLFVKQHLTVFQLNNPFINIHSIY